MWLRLLIALTLLLGGLHAPTSWSSALADYGSEGGDDHGGGKGGGDNRGGGKGGEDHGGKGGGNGSGKDENKSSKGNPGPSSSSGAPGRSGEVRSYYGQVTVNAAGQVLCGNTLVQSTSPWLKLAAPGMWLEASGTWDGETFVASEVRLQVPQEWAYYQGPASLIGAKDYRYAAAWLGRGSGSFLALKAAPDSSNGVRMVAYYDGSKLRAVPASFPAPPAGLKPGWVELSGTLTAQGLVWTSGRSFP